MYTENQRNKYTHFYKVALSNFPSATSCRLFLKYRCMIPHNQFNTSQAGGIFGIFSI